MPTANRPWKGVVVLLITLLVVIVIGCGGGGGGGGTGLTTATGGTTAGGTTGTPGNGTAQFTIQWPSLPSASFRALPSYTMSVVISVFTFDTNQIVAQQTIDRTQSTAYQQVVPFTLPAGKYNIVVEAKPNAAGGGDTIATDTVTTTVSEGQTASTTLVFTALVTKMFIDDLPATATIGTPFQVHAHAEDQNGNAILLPSDALHWSIISGSSFATITSDGIFTPNAPGPVTIQVEEVDSGLKATKSITLQQGSQNGVVVIVS